MSKRLRLIAALAAAVLSGCARPASSPLAAAPTPSLPVITLPPTATFVPTLSGAPTHTPIPTVTPTPIIYVVQKGDILGKIALDFDVSLEALIAANGLQSAHVLNIGQRLIIPNESMLSDLAQAGVDVAPAVSTVIVPTPTLLPGSVIWEALDGYVGQTVKVEGLVVRTRKAGGSVFLLYHDPPLAYLRVKIPPDVLEAFGGRPEIDLLDKWILVEGLVEQGSDGVQIVARDPSQVQVLP